MGRGLVGRSVLECPAGECIILHYPRRLPTEEEVSTYTNTLSVRQGDLAAGAGSPWNTEDSFGGVGGTFNCCTFAVGELLGLSTADWLAPNATGDTNYTVPMRIVLESYFEPIRSYKGPDIDWESIEGDKELRDDDVLCFVNMADSGEEYAHVGRIRKRSVVNLLISKLGIGPNVESPMRATAMDFRGQFRDVRIYRRAK